MRLERLQKKWETLEGEGLKTAAEISLHGLAAHRFGNHVLDFVRGGERIEDPRLNVEVAGIAFENPVGVGAGWDKQGRCVDGLYQLNFAFTEVGTVLYFAQDGNPKPRLFTDSSHSRGLNRLGFNSPGVELVQRNMDSQQRPGKIGINVGVNKRMLERFADQVPKAHAEVVNTLFNYGDYFVINVSSPNTPGLRDQLNPEFLRPIILAVKDVLRHRGDKPLFVKTTVDLAIEDLSVLLQVLVDEGVDGIIDTNTTIDDALKFKYGWDEVYYG
jgi:dihydroorotate dehydrogenase